MMLMLSLLVTCLSAWAGAQPISLRAADGVSLRASVQSPQGAKRGVVMVHMDGRSSADWASLADRLARGGISTVAPDLRGHGESGGSVDYASMVQDVSASVAWLRAQGVEQVVCLGAELGANLCLAAAVQDAAISSVAMLSPQLNHKGLVAPKSMQGYTDRPAMIVVSDDDPGASRCGDILAQLAGERAQVVVLAAAGTGTRMLSRDPGLEGRLVAWLSGAVDLQADVGAGFRPSTTEQTTVAAEGEKLRAHQ